MAEVQFHNGLPLFTSNGAVAMDPSCCCDQSGCCVEPWLPILDGNPHLLHADITWSGDILGMFVGAEPCEAYIPGYIDVPDEEQTINGKQCRVWKGFHAYCYLGCPTPPGLAAISVWHYVACCGDSFLYRMEILAEFPTSSQVVHDSGWLTPEELSEFCCRAGAIHWTYDTGEFSISDCTTGSLFAEYGNHPDYNCLPVETFTESMPLMSSAPSTSMRMGSGKVKLDLKSQIPNHPEKCKGVSSPYYSPDQCRLCWMATYDERMRKKWGILGKLPPNNVLTPETTYPCRFRSKERQQAAGCGGCNGLSFVNKCNFSGINSGLCHVADLGKGSSVTARSHGYGVCSECGYREPEEGLVPSVPQMIQLLNEDPGILPIDFQKLKSTHYAFQTLFREQCVRTYNPPSQKKNKGRGIVIGAGGETYFKNAWVCAYRLRQLGCTLPIQFWYLGWPEADAQMVDACRQVGIECIDATSVANSLSQPPRILSGWELKPFSVIHSPFREVLYLDADCIPAVDPTYLFDCPEYLSTGSIFWPDLPPSNKLCWIPEDVWKLYGLTVDTKPDFESGQFLINKMKCWKELNVTMWLNEHSDFVYQHVYGDKSTYHLAWRGCETEYSMPSKLATWSTPAIQQFDFQGRLVFQHCCQGKSYLANGLRIPSLVNPRVAVEAIEQLKNVWRDYGMYRPDSPLLRGTYQVQGPGIDLPIEFLSGGLLKGNPPSIRRWGTLGSDVVLLGHRGRGNNIVALDRLTPQGTNWSGNVYRLTKCNE